MQEANRVNRTPATYIDCVGDGAAARELAIVERFDAHCLCAPRNRLQKAI